MTRRPTQAYAAAMRTMAGTRQIVVLYDAVLRNLHLAARAMQDNQVEERYNRLTHAAKIVFGLQNCLDFEKGGEIAKILHNFYLSVTMRIFNLHHSNSAKECEQLMAEVKQMRDAWNAVDHGDPAEAPAPQEDVTDTPGPTGITISA